MSGRGGRGGRGGRAEDGTATVEFVLLAVVVLVPFVYAVLCLFEVQRAAYALSAATREAGRAFVTAQSGDAAQERAKAAADLVLADHGLRVGRGPTIECSADPCLTPGSRIAVELTVRVPLPLLPSWGRDAPASVRVHARHVEVVDDYRERRP